MLFGLLLNLFVLSHRLVIAFAMKFTITYRICNGAMMSIDTSITTDGMMEPKLVLDSSKPSHIVSGMIWWIMLGFASLPMWVDLIWWSTTWHGTTWVILGRPTPWYGPNTTTVIHSLYLVFGATEPDDEAEYVDSHDDVLWYLVGELEPVEEVVDLAGEIDLDRLLLSEQLEESEYVRSWFYCIRIESHQSWRQYDIRITVSMSRWSNFLLLWGRYSLVSLIFLHNFWTQSFLCIWNIFPLWMSLHFFLTWLKSDTLHCRNAHPWQSQKKPIELMKVVEDASQNMQTFGLHLLQ